MECDCCGLQRPVAAILRRNRIQRSDTHDFQAGIAVPLPATAFVRHPLCEICIAWLTSVVANLALPGHSAVGPLLGAPGSRTRVRVFPDQCQLCKEMLGESGVLIDSVVAGGGGAALLPGMLVCDACDTWVGGLAEDGRSARGNAERAIDGQYGSWPHPNLREIAVRLRVRDAGLEASIRASCRRMGVEILDPPAPHAVLMIEAGVEGGAAPFLRARGVPVAGCLVLARIAEEQDLKACLELGISSWLTVPVTPQQVSAALSSVARQPGLRRRWEMATALPHVDLDYLARPALGITPAAGVTAFEAAWFVRRVTRGYDDVGVAEGVVIVVPRAPETDLARVQARIGRALAGRCTVEILDAHSRRRRRLEAAG